MLVEKTPSICVKKNVATENFSLKSVPFVLK